jgi:hypothetical protein
MRITHIDDTYVIRIDKGEKVIETLTNWCKEQNIHAGTLTGIGAVESASFGHYDLDEKKYYFTQYDEMLEVASMIGNVALKDGEPFLHAHGVFSGPGNQTLGGHIEEMVAGVVIEVALRPLAKDVVRTHDENVGLYLMNL